VTDQGAQKDPEAVPEADLRAIVAEGEGPWVSDPPAGPKVCTLRLDSTHLLHTGLGGGWSVVEIQAYFADCARELIRPAPGGMVPPGEWPTEINGWGEAIRFAQDEFWAAAEPQGTTVALDLGEHLWVLSRGAHGVSICNESDGRTPERFSRPSWGGSVWRLDRKMTWRVEVSLEDGPGAIWTARWRGETPKPVPAAQTPASLPAAPAEPRRETVTVASWWAGLSPTMRRRLRIGGGVVAAFLVLALALAAIPRDVIEGNWVRVGDFVAARYRAQVTSYPEGAKILVDGVETSLVTPAEVLLDRGTHRVEASLGEFGSQSFELEGGRGDRVDHHVDLIGRLFVANADSSVVLFARLDGEPVGELPAMLDSVAAGRRQISFQGRDVHPWVEEVDVVVDGTTQIVAQPERVPDKGVVVARAYTVSAEGLEEVKGAAVYLDGKRVGWTPTRLEVPRGYHTVRLVSAWDRSPVQLLRVDGGGELFATAEFGRSPEPEVHLDAPTRVAQGSSPIVQARLSSTGPIRIREMRFFWRGEDSEDGEFERLAMKVETTPLGITGRIVPPTYGFEPGSWMQYFIVVESDQGEEFVSEMQRLRITP
jgi:hypothetical protein